MEGTLALMVVDRELRCRQEEPLCRGVGQDRMALLS